MGGSKKTTKTKKTTENLLPEYMRAGSERAVRMATDRTNQDYQAYGGQRIADMSENEMMGISRAKREADMGAEDFASSRSALQRLGGSFTDEGVAEQYMNPFIEQVMQPGLRRKNEAFEAERASRQQQRGMTGAFGGRGQMYDTQFERNFQESQDEYMGSMRGAAYSEASGLYGAEQDRALSESAAYSNLATARSAESRNRIYDLMNTGLIERTQEQASLDFKYIEAIEARDWDVNNLSTLVDTLAKVPAETTQKIDSKTVEKTKPNAMKIVAGVAMIAAGVMTGGAALAPMIAGGSSMIGGA